MENVARLSEHRVDLRNHQSLLVEAEIASMASLGKCCGAGAAFVDMFHDLDMSVVHPGVREMLDRLPKIIENAASVPRAISECHVLAQRIVKTTPKGGDVLLSGGIPKGPIDPQHNG